MYELLARHKAEGQAAFEPRSRRPHTSPTAVPDRTVAAIVEVRKDLAGQGLDAGPDTIAWHRAQHRKIQVSPATPAAAYQTRPKATPSNRDADTHDRVRNGRVDDSGVVTLRVGGRLHHIGIGRTHARTHVILLVQDLQIRVINAVTGELLRDLVLDPSRDYQRTGRPPGPTRK